MTMSHLPLMLEAAVAAAKVILEVYEQPFAHQHKADSSPVTEADTRAEEVILEMLGPTGVPVLAEESVAAGNIPELGHSFFVVDPLDGTKEFVKRNGEFTVNIALCIDGRPVEGVVLAPAGGEACWGSADGAFTAPFDGAGLGASRPIKASPHPPYRIVASRSHKHGPLAELCEKMQVIEDVSVGSSLKFCLVARGAAQFYPRFTPTSEWDTAAGQAVVEAAGGVVLGLDGRPLTCGHGDLGFLNGFFVAAASRELAEVTLHEMRRLTA